MTTEAAIKDKACLEQQVEDLQVLIRNVNYPKFKFKILTPTEFQLCSFFLKIEFEKNELCQQIDILQNQFEEIESKFHSQNYELAQTAQDLNDQKSTTTQIRLLAEESERAMDELRRQLAMKNEELRSLDQTNHRLEQKLGKTFR